MRLGEHDTRLAKDDSRMEVEISSAIPHERFNRTLKINDIALIHLAKHVEFTGRLSLLSSYMDKKDSNSDIAL